MITCRLGTPLDTLIGSVNFQWVNSLDSFIDRNDEKADKEFLAHVTQVKGQMSFLMLLKNEPVPNPEPNAFRIISKSTLPALSTTRTLPLAAI